MTTLNPPSILSMGSLRRRWERHITMTRATSSPVTWSRPHQAACALAQRLVTMSPRSPSTFRFEHTSEILRLSAGSSFTLKRRSLQALSLAVSASLSSWQVARYPNLLRSNIMRLVAISVRSSMSMIVRTCTLRPKRSSSCGRSSPSSSLPEPTMMNLAGCEMDTPSRSTVFHPEAAESSTTSTSPSSSRFTSSTYRMPRFAFARSPGS
mmetsp:Transcript_45829/g.76416  ORF Transcript_45829/g.76416 Transcript_45829/m.76416 type:complete len:209 (-) Transcript_45829:704-1330(-)